MPEIPWNDTCASTLISNFEGYAVPYGASGFCATALGEQLELPTDPYSSSPCSGAPSNWALGGGTSFAGPVMSGMQALVNEVWGGRQGNPAPIYYSLANQEYGTHGNKACQSFVSGGPAWYCTFNDVTVGDNDVDCIGPYNCYDPDANQGVVSVLSLSDKFYQPAFTASVGWDFTSGIGSVNTTNLVLNPI